jgi:cyclic pyranopterin phosphate synthase
MDRKFTHITGSGKAKMVDVSRKRPSKRRASASCLVRTTAPNDALSSSSNGVDQTLVAQLAGIMAAKKTAELIPLCHPVGLGAIEVELTWVEVGVEITATISAVDRTGVEMEALTACAIAALSVIDSIVDVDPNAQMDDLVLLSKSGGKSGPWGRLVDSPSSSDPP